MGIVTRYVLCEVIKAFLVALFVMTLMMTVGGGAKQAHGQGLPPLQILQLMPYVLPETLRFTIPGAILLAVSVVFGRMSGFNEVVALKSLGINPLRVIWPVLALSVVLSMVTFWLYDVCAAWARPRMRIVVLESVEQIAYGMLRTQRSYSSPKFSIIVRRVEGRRLVQPLITLKSAEDGSTITLSAEEAELYTDRRSAALSIICRNGTLDVEGQARLRFQDVMEQSIPFDQPEPHDTLGKSPSWLPMSVISGQVARQEQYLAQAIQGLSQLEPDDPGRRSQLESFQFHRDYLLRLLTEPHRRLANGFSCCCFVLFGVAVAIWRRSADFLSSFFICFLPILLIYYPLLVVGENLARSGAMPPYSVWLGDGIFLGAGGWLLRRVIRY